MLQARQFPAVPALLLTAATCFVFLLAASARADSSTGSCEQAAQVAVLPSPLAPWKGSPLRVLVAAEKPLQGELSLIGPDGRVAAQSTDREGGPPYYWYVEVASPAAGSWRATLSIAGGSPPCGTITQDIAVSAAKPPGLEGRPGSLWPIRASWNRATENLFSAWIAKLFDGPLDQELSWKTWVEVLHDRSRNMLFDYLGLGEDNLLKATRPDCADFVYFLRAYFAFKMGLPFGYSNCSRGNAGAPPKCYQWFDIEHPEVTRPAPPPDELNDLKSLKSCYGMLAENYEKLGNSAKSLEYSGLFNTLQKHFQQQELELADQRTKWAEAEKMAKESQLQSTYDTLNEVMQVSRERQMQINLLNKEKEIQLLAIKEKEARLKNERLISRSLMGGLLLLVIIVVLIFIQFRNKHKANLLLGAKNIEISTQKQKIDDSIHYANRIQTAVLIPRPEAISSLPEYFIFFKPREVVSGDFFWISDKGTKIFMAAVDCTGHGVPGAFMSMLAISFLNEIVSLIPDAQDPVLASDILNQLREHITGYSTKPA